MLRISTYQIPQEFVDFVEIIGIGKGEFDFRVLTQKEASTVKVLTNYYSPLGTTLLFRVYLFRVYFTIDGSSNQQ